MVISNVADAPTKELAVLAVVIVLKGIIVRNRNHKDGKWRARQAEGKTNREQEESKTNRQ